MQKTHELQKHIVQSIHVLRTFENTGKRVTYVTTTVCSCFPIKKEKTRPQNAFITKNAGIRGNTARSVVQNPPGHQRLRDLVLTLLFVTLIVTLLMCFWVSRLSGNPKRPVLRIIFGLFQAVPIKHALICFRRCIIFCEGGKGDNTDPFNEAVCEISKYPAWLSDAAQ